MKILISILVIIITTLIILYYINNKVDTMEIEAIKVESAHAKKQMKLNGFRCCGKGGGGNGKQFHKLGITFSTHEQLNISTARKYLVEGLLLYYNDINSAQSLQPYLIERPFPIGKIKYSIYVHGDNGSWPLFPNGPTSDQKISYVRWDENEIRYQIQTERDARPITIHTETFDEAVAILNAEKSRSNH